MSTPPRLVILGCTSFSTGEMTLALDWVRQCTTRFELHIVVGNPLADGVRHAGGTVHTYPAFNVQQAVRTIRGHLARLRPDVLLLADLLHFCGVSGEFGTLLMPLVEDVKDHCRILGLDLYDLHAHPTAFDLFGRPAPVPAPLSNVGRLLPSPYLPPQKSTPGRGRYPMMRDGAPVSAARQRDACATLSLPDQPVVLLTTSPWQHLCADYPESRRMATHLPALLMRILDAAVAQSGPVTLLHLGPQSLAVPSDVTHLQYTHLPQVSPDVFRRVLESTTVVLSPNVIASTSIRAAGMRIPVAALHLGRARSRPDGTGCVRQFLDAAAPTYACSVWPLGFHALMGTVMHNNPFREIQDHLDALDAPAASSHLAALLNGGPAADDLRQRQSNYFALLNTVMDTPDQALHAALDH